MSTTSSESARQAQPTTPLNILLALKQRLGLFLVFVIIGLILGFLVYLATPTAYEAKGTFLIDKLPFGFGVDTPVDAETERQIVQSFILSIPSEEMRKAIAEQVGVPDTDLAFADHDRPVSLFSLNKKKANISITSTRNSRIAVITAVSADPEFAAQVVAAIFEKIQNINQIAGSMAQIDSRLKLAQTEATNFIQELTTASADRIKFEQQNQALDHFLAQKYPLETFPGFALDSTLSNLKTQFILVSSEYDAIAAQSSTGTKLEGKKAELDGLRLQLNSYLKGLVAGLRSSLQISKTREESLRSNLAAVEQEMTAQQTLHAGLAKGFGDFKIRQDLIGATTPDQINEASVIVVIDPAHAIARPVQPNFTIDMGLGLLFGLALGLGSILLLLQVRPPSP